MHVRNRRIAENFKDRSIKIPHLLAMRYSGERCYRRRGHAGRGNSDLSTSFLNLVQDHAKGRLGKASVEPGLLVVLISRTQSFGAIIECVTKRFMDAFESVAPSHENLQSDKLRAQHWSEYSFTLSKAVEHARGWVATKIGLFDMFDANNDRNQRSSSRHFARYSR